MRYPKTRSYKVFRRPEIYDRPAPRSRLTTADMTAPPATVTPTDFEALLTDLTYCGYFGSNGIDLIGKF